MPKICLPDRYLDFPSLLEEESLRKKEIYQAQRFRSRSDKSTRKMEAYSPPVGMPIQKHHSTSPTKTLFHAERVTVIECRTVSSSAQLLKFSTASQQKNKQTGTAAEEEALVNFNNNFQISKSKGPSATTDTSDPQKKLRKAFNDPYYRRYRSRLGSPPQRISKNDCDDDMPKVARPTPTVQSRSMGIRQMKQMLAVQYNICRGCCTQVQAEEEEVQSALAGGVWHRKCRKCQNCGKLISRSSMCEAG